MYVCVCKAVTERQIETAVRAGAHTLGDLRRELDITRECGRCTSCAKQCLKAARERETAANDAVQAIYA